MFLGSMIGNLEASFYYLDMPNKSCDLYIQHIKFNIEDS